MTHAEHLLPLSSIVLAALGSASAGCSSQECNALYAPSRATMTRQVTATFDASKPLDVELCHNDACRSGQFSIARDAGACSSTGGSLLRGGCDLRRSDDGTWQFHVRWDQEDASPMENGDRYRVRLTSGAVVLLAEDVRATYAESEPNGEGCGITKDATL